MTLMVPASSGFAVGTSTPPGGDSGMEKSLDQMIADRRKSQQQTMKRGPKKAATADRAVGAGRAKRQAAINARRGMTETKKPDVMEVERQVYRQSRMTAQSKDNKEQKATGGRMAPNSSNSRRNQKKKEATSEFVVTRAPSKKVVAAAVVAMKKEGYVVPEGMKVVISLVPGPQKNVQPAAKKPQNGGKGGNSNKGKKPTGNAKSNKGGNRKS